MREIHLKELRLTDEEALELRGKCLDDTFYDQFFAGEDVAVYKPNGELLFKLVTNCVPPSLCRRGYKALRNAARETTNRGAAAGGVPENLTNAIPSGKLSYKAIRKDGRISKRTYSREVQSGVVGFMDRYPSFPYCRLTAFNMEEPDAFCNALPLIQRVNELFREHVPDRWKNQREMIEKTHPDFYIHDTVFTTVTVNRNFQTSVHKDAGDLKQGFGVMMAFRAGKFTGGRLVFPQFGVATEMTTGDVLFADVHEWHANTPLVGIPGQWERISLVLYYRAKMIYCGSAEQELELAKSREQGDSLLVDPRSLA